MKKSTADNPPDTQILTFDSQSPSTFRFGGREEGMDNYLQDTEVFDSQAHGLDAQFKTVRLDDLDFGDGSAYEDEVVLDSEDEDMLQANSRVRKVVGRGQVVSEIRPVDLIVQQHGDKKSAVDSQSSSANHGQTRFLFDPIPDNLNYTHSEVPGDSSQAQALDFVDQFVSYNDEDLSQRQNFMKSSGGESPLISRAKGTCILAQILRPQTANVGTFQWDDSKQLVENSVSSKKIEASLINYKARLTGNEIDGKEPKNNKDTMELTMGEKETNKKGKVLEGPNVMEDTPNMYDIGVNTQIAAEAMEALFYGLPTICNENNACKDLRNTSDRPSDFVTNNALHTENSAPHRSLDPDVECIAGQLKQEKLSVQKVYHRRSKNESKRQKLDIKLSMTENVKKDNIQAKRQVNVNNLHNLSCRNEDFGTLSHALVVQRKGNGYESRNNIENSSHQTKVLNDCSNFSPLDHTARHGVLADVVGKAQLKVTDVTEGGIIAYTRKRTPRNGKFLRQTKREVTGISILSELDPWNIPRRRRTCRNVGKNSNSSGDLQSTPRAIPGSKRTNRYVKGLRSANKKAMCSEWNGKGVSRSSNCPVQHFSEYKADVRQDFDRQGSAKSLTNSELAVGNNVVPSMQQDLAKAYIRLGSRRGENSISYTSDAKRASSKKKTGLSGQKSARSVQGIKVKNFEASDYNCHEQNRKPCTRNLPRASLLKELIKLGVPESMPSSNWKDFRKRRDTTSIRVLFSQHLDHDVLKQQKKIATKLGISIVDYSKDATHFIADNFIRTRNMLEAIALGKPVVTHLWLESCGQAGYLIDEKNYILRDTKKEKEIGFSMPVSLSRASYQPLLKGFRLFITPRIKPDKETITNLVYTVHGQTADKSLISTDTDKKIPDDLLILSCEEDYPSCKPFLEKGATVYSSELLLNGIIIQKLEFVRHQLFRNHVKRSDRSKRSKKYAGSSKM